MADEVQQRDSSADTLTKDAADMLVSDPASRHAEDCAEWLAEAYRRWMKRCYPEDSALVRELFTSAMDMKRCRAGRDIDYVTRAQDSQNMVYGASHVSHWRKDGTR